MITIKDIARLSGTSATAVSFVLNNKDQGKVNPRKKQRILELIGKHDYRRNRVAQSLKLRKTFNIAICIQGSLGQQPIIGNYSHHELLNQIAKRCHQAGYSNDLIQIDVDKSPDQVTRQLKHHSADGFVFLNWSPNALQPLVHTLEQRNIPIVSVGTPLACSPLWVIYDRATSFFNGATYLLDQNLKKICVLDTLTNSLHADSKYEAYQAALRKRGLTPSPPFRVSSMTMKSVMTALNELLHAVPDVDGIILTDNAFAPYIVAGLEGKAIRVLGFGDAGFAQMCDPRLSYMRFPIEAVAESAVNMLLNQLTPLEHLRLCSQRHQCELIVQDT
ncbi:MAG: LacI family DNA-binding transcriptional regulator [Kiritimatiellae bacterium]|nr:LacI family DNA-binding transcriptional regulator [Kiritimatiellia bacterium]